MSYISKIIYSPFFQNKFVLYGSLLLVLLAIIRFLAKHNFNAIVLMALIGLLMSYFSKNMIIILLTSLFAVTILEFVRGDMMIEGMATKEGEDTQKKADDEPSESGDAVDKEDAKKDAKDKPKSKVTPVNEDTDTSSESTGKKEEPKGENLSVMSEDDKKKKGKQGMSKMSPANYDGKETDDDKTGNRIDYASTLEQAYDNIEGIIGEDGVRGLTDQTKSLMNQQKQLMENMKDMGPLLKSAEGFMKQMTGGGGIEGITSMLKGFAGTSK